MEENKEETKEKKFIKENEASFLRWVATIIVALLMGTLFSIVPCMVVAIMAMTLPAMREGGALSGYVGYINLLVSFGGYYWGAVFSIKIIAKTSIKSFILGAGRTEKVSIRKEVLPVGLLYLLGIILTSVLPDIKNITYSGMNIKIFLFILVFSLIFAWMQTSFEELLFRGIPLRFLCKNKITWSLKVFLITLIPSALFMLAHITNPEVQQFSGIQKTFMILTYLVPAIGLTVCDMLCGNILPGLVIHWVNNFFGFVILGTEVSASGGTSIFVDHTSPSGIGSFVFQIIAYVPVVVYLVLKKKNVIGDGSH